MAVCAYIIRDSAGKLQIIQMQSGGGMQTFDHVLRDLVLRGLLTYEGAMSRSHNPAELEIMISIGMARLQAAANRRRKK